METNQSEYPKPGCSTTRTKPLRPISLMSFIPKTLEKLLDRHIRDRVLVRSPLHQDQYAYRPGMSTETALHKLTKRLEKTLDCGEVALGAFLDIEGAFDNTTFQSIITNARKRGIEGTCCRWISSMLGGRVVHLSLLGTEIASQGVRGCPQGGGSIATALESGSRWTAE